MQVGGTVQVASTIHPRRRLNVVLAIAAIVVIAAVVALVMWVVPLATSGGVTEDAIPKAGTGSAVSTTWGTCLLPGIPLPLRATQGLTCLTLPLRASRVLEVPTSFGEQGA